MATRQEGEEADERIYDETGCRESSLISPCNAVDDTDTSLKNKQINSLPLSSSIISLLLLLIRKSIE